MSGDFEFVLEDALKVDQLIGGRRTSLANRTQSGMLFCNLENALVDALPIFFNVHLRAVWHHDDMLSGRDEIRQINRRGRSFRATLVFHFWRKLADDLS